MTGGFVDAQASLLVLGAVLIEIIYIAIKNQIFHLSVSVTEDRRGIS